MDILYLVDRLEKLIAGSKKLPWGNQLMIKEPDIMNIVEQMRTTIPDEIKQARRVIQEKERILAQAQADASTLLTKAREETERVMNQQGLLRAAEIRSRELVQAAEERAHKVIEQAEEQNEQLKVDADTYVAETLSNLKDHLANIEMDISRSILSIEKGLETLEIPMEAVVEVEEDYGDDEGAGEDEEERYVASPPEGELPTSGRPVPRRSSLANDTIGGPMYPTNAPVSGFQGPQ